MTDPPAASETDDDRRTVLDWMSDGFFAVDAGWRITYANERGTALLRSATANDVVESAETIDGLHLWESIPEATDTEFYGTTRARTTTTGESSCDPAAVRGLVRPRPELRGEDRDAT